MAMRGEFPKFPLEASVSALPSGPRAAGLIHPPPLPFFNNTSGARSIP
jgi:hypothetical protein